MRRESAELLERRRQIDDLRRIFVAELGVSPKQSKWGNHNIMRMFNATGEPTDRVYQMVDLFRCLADCRNCGWFFQGGVFDHGELWNRNGVPSVLVGHPYGITDDQRGMLDELASFPCLRVSVDDRPSHYGFGTNHVRIDVHEPRRPWKPGRIVTNAR